MTVKQIFFIFLMSMSFSSAAELSWRTFGYPIDDYRSAEAKRIADNMVFFQRPSGGWSKKIDPSGNYGSLELEALGIKEKLLSELYDKASAKSYSHSASTLDNGATYNHVRFLLRVSEATNNEKYKTSCLKGIEYLLSAQYESGGWPQNYPNLSSYGGHVTFNDDAMTGAMRTIQDVLYGNYSFIDNVMKARTKSSFEKAIDYVIRSQIVVKGVKTGWAQQYDLQMKPAQGRTYELPAITPQESVKVVHELMRIKEPSLQVQNAIESAVKWLDSVKIEGLRVDNVYSVALSEPFSLVLKEDPMATTVSTHVFKGVGYDRVVVNDPSAKPIWARFHDVNTMKPLFSDWSGMKKSSLAEIDYERRVDYVWYGYWPEVLIKSGYRQWKNGLPVGIQAPIAPNLQLD